MSKPNEYELIHKLTAFLAGWNLFVIIGLASLFALSYLSTMIFGRIDDGGLLFWISTLIAIALGGFTGYLGAKRLFGYFSIFKTIGSLGWLTVMVYITVTTLPTQFFATAP
jgi:hypothetical protein